MNNTLAYLLFEFTKINSIQINKEEAQIQLLSHPYYPSLNSITDLFNHFNIDNLALEVTPDGETYSQLPNTFLAQIKEGNSNSLVLVKKERKKERKKALN